MTERHTTVGEHVFETNGYFDRFGLARRRGQMPKDTLLIPIKDKETVAVKALEIEAKKTTPPPRYNEATLLSAMEGAGNWWKTKNYGKPSVLAVWAHRQRAPPSLKGWCANGICCGRDETFIPPPKAQSLVRLLRALKIEALILPETTGDWEYRRATNRAKRKKIERILCRKYAN